MSLRLIALAVLLITTMVVCHPTPDSEVDKGVKQVTDFLTQLQASVNQLASSLADTEAFKHLQKFGDEVSAKGKELQEKFTETLQNMGPKQTDNEKNL